RPSSSLGRLLSTSTRAPCSSAPHWASLAAGSWGNAASSTARLRPCCFQRCRSARRWPRAGSHWGPAICCQPCHSAASWVSISTGSAFIRLSGGELCTSVMLGGSLSVRTGSALGQCIGFGAQDRLEQVLQQRALAGEDMHVGLHAGDDRTRVVADRRL